MNQIIKQPDGQYAIWSSVVDDFLLINAGSGDIVDFMVDESRSKIRDMVSVRVESLDQADEKTNELLFANKLKRIREIHGDGHELLKYFHCEGKQA